MEKSGGEVDKIKKEMKRKDERKMMEDMVKKMRSEESKDGDERKVEIMLGLRKSKDIDIIEKEGKKEDEEGKKERIIIEEEWKSVGLGSMGLGRNEIGR